ncbi:hypothetical protein C8F01DRAFT_1354141 [Mycena amicta]|nr:hypothetical protein C8F01DRAFT_1354141 [Mycena amicta]
MSSAPATASKLFQKRRRAYIACSNCRKRKIKCITTSDAEYRPCTRCAQKGLVCEYIAVPDDALLPDTPPGSVEAAESSSSTSHVRRAPDDWSHAITPPSAGLSGFLPPSSTSARGNRSAHSHSHSQLPTAQSSLYRPQTWPSGASPATSSSRISQPRLDPAYGSVQASGMVMGAYGSSPYAHSAYPSTSYGQQQQQPGFVPAAAASVPRERRATVVQASHDNARTRALDAV